MTAQVAMVLDTLSASDRVNLLELYSRSAMLLELARPEEWTELFEPLGAITVTTADAAPSTLEFRGRSELLALARRMTSGEYDLAAGLLSPRVKCHHTLANICLYSHGRGAAGYAHLTVTCGGGSEPPRWLASGLYADQLTRCSSGCWRFRARTYVASSSLTAATAVPPPPRLKVGA